MGRPVDVERGTERNAFWYLTGIRAEEDGADSKFSAGRQRDPLPIRWPCREMGYSQAHAALGGIVDGYRDYRAVAVGFGLWSALWTTEFSTIRNDENTRLPPSGDQTGNV